MSKKKIYIAGGITREPVSQCYNKFEKAEYELEMDIFKDDDIEVINPLKIEGITFGIGYDKAMSLCFHELIKCNIIFMLHGWEESNGATKEHEFAKEHGITIIYQ